MSGNEPMTTSRPADRLLATYGADPARWPEAARVLAAECDPQQRAAEAALDDWLASSKPPPLPASLRAAILEKTRPAPARPGWRETLQLFWQEIGGARLAAPAFALALMAGIGLGAGLGANLGANSDTEYGDDLLTLALIDSDYLALTP